MTGSIGDVVEANVAREEFNEVLENLHRHGVGREGGILVQSPTATAFDEAARIEESAPGDADEAVIWDSVLEKAAAGAQPTVSCLLFLLVAVTLAGIAVILDSGILVVGAMVVRTEFSAVGAVAVGVAFGKWPLVGRGVRLLVGQPQLVVCLSFD